MGYLKRQVSLEVILLKSHLGAKEVHPEATLMVSFIIQGAKGTQSFPSFPFLFGWQRSAVGLNEQAVINNKACSG